MALQARCSTCSALFYVEAEDPRRRHSEPSRAWGVEVDPVCDDCRRVRAAALRARESDVERRELRSAELETRVASLEIELARARRPGGGKL